MKAKPIFSNGPWRQLVKVKNALCADGKRRVATITGQPDTFWTVPAKVKCKGKTVSGFLTSEDKDYYFQ